MTDLLTTKQVQTLLRVDRTTIYRMVESGQLPAIRVGKQWRFAKSDVEQWLRSVRSQHYALAAPRQSEVRVANEATEAPAATSPDLRTLLPLACVQLIQDTFAEMLGVMILVTDMQGQPITQISNPCQYFVSLIEEAPHVLEHCVHTWQQLAGDPALAPKFSTSELELLCARGVIRVGTELKGMVVLGGIAPEVWPPSNEQIANIAAALDLSPTAVQADISAVYRLDRAAQARMLGFVQRIADIISHVIEDRGRTLGAQA